jgi:dTDP-4-dehydrorhamnose 3,5-epimerase-like enzyme
MILEFNKSINDVRGTILFCSYGELTINFVYTKKGFSRGGHYHNFKSDHILLQGKIEFKKLNLDTNVENISMLSAPCNISVEPKTAHLLTSLNNSLFLEYFNTEYSAINYSPYRKIVNEKIKNVTK